MTKAPIIYWLLKNEVPWSSFKNTLIAKGFQLEHHYISNDLGILICDDISNLNDADITNKSLYKILLFHNKSPLYQNKLLHLFNEYIFLESVHSEINIDKHIAKFNDWHKKTNLNNLEKSKLLLEIKNSEYDIQIKNNTYNDLSTELSENLLNFQNDSHKNHSLLKFILLLSQEIEINKILNLFLKELNIFKNLFNIYLLTSELSSNNESLDRIYHKANGIFISKKLPIHSLKNLNPQLITEASFNKSEWKNIFTKYHQENDTEYFSFPLQKYFRNKNLNKKSILFIEHKFESDDYATIIKFISERLPFLGMSIEKAQTVNAIKLKNKLWEKTFDGINDPLVILDDSFQIIRSNLEFSNLKTTSNNQKKQFCYSYLNQTEKPCPSCPLEQFKSTREQNLNHIFEELFVNENIFNVHSYPLTSSIHNKYYINHYANVTKQKDLQHKSHLIDKIKILDAFAEPLITTLSRPLQIIKEALTLFYQDTLPADALDIFNAVERSQHILDQLTKFSKGDAELESIYIDQLIDSTLPFFKSLKRKNKINLNLRSENIKVQVSPSLFQQVIFNLINNACQAMKSTGGVINISSSEFRLNEKNGVKIEITDNGPGISESVRNKIFHSFVTTKSLTEGTGLGLKFCYNVIHSFQGVINYEPNQPHGSIFWIWLPAYFES